MISFRILVSLLLVFLAGALSAQAQHTGADSERRGLLGVLLDGNYAPDGTSSQAAGVKISEVTPGLAADRADLKPGDIVLAVNGRKVQTVRALQIEISSRKPGEQVTLTVLRDGSIFQRPVILGDWFDFLVRTPIFGPFLNDVTLIPLNDPIRRQLKLPDSVEGAVVSQVAERSLYGFIFRPGSVITKVNGVPIRNADLSEEALAGGPLTLEYFSAGSYGSFTLTNP